MSVVCRDIPIFAISKDKIMATIRFRCVGKNNPANLNIRFISGKKIECNAQSHILIDPNLWSETMQNFKPNVKIEVKKKYLPLIENLKSEIITKFNSDYSKGEKINSDWLRKVIAKFYERPEGKDDFEVYFAPFIEKFAKDSEKRLNPISGKIISPRTIQKYNTIKKLIVEYEVTKKTRLKITDINLEFHKNFTSHLKTVKNYSNTVIEKNISTIKGFVKEAKEYGYKTNPEAESKKFTFRRDEPIDTYLNVDEIDLIFNLDLTNNERLDKVRDAVIIGVWTGLRISDLKRINQFLFKKDTIVIAETQKTGTTVEIPIHPQVRSILQKRGNNLSDIVISEQKFNLYIKELCEKVGLNEIILGNIKNPETNRKEKGYYPKYKLISSHSLRRSFASNHIGHLPENTIMAITGHKSHSQFMKYVKTTQNEHIQKVAKYWEQQDELKNAKPTLKVVN